LTLVAIAPCRAQEAEAAPEPEPIATEMETVVVTGARSGPDLWKVSKGDHELWILGTVRPLPAGIEWRADAVRDVLERADQVLESPGVDVAADVGFFRKLTLLPSAMKVMKNPDGTTLEEVLPEATYARWAALKQRHIGRDASIEKKRPFFAAYELERRALKKSGLGGSVVQRALSRMMSQRGLKSMEAELQITVDNPKAALADARKEPSNAAEIACLEDTMTRLERDLPRMIDRANAWAVGNLQTLRELPLTDRYSCTLAWSGTSLAEKYGMADIQSRIDTTWLDAADAALEKNRVTFSMLPIDELLSANGLLAKLRAKGYEVEAPE
jgi:hypothetical protein